MKRRSGWLRRIEIALWIMGLSLLGLAARATLTRWNYQAQQERALLEGAPAVSAPSHTDPAPALSARAGADHAVPPSDQAVEPATAADSDAVTPVKRIASEPQRVPKRRGDALGLIEIPRLGVKAVFKEGADDATLARAVGLVPGSALPGQRGNMVLAGHRDTFFHDLSDVQVFDRIRIVIPPRTYVYRVESLRVVTPEDTNVLKSKGVDELTLVTCYPFRFIGPAPDRYIISAVRVN